MNDNVERVAEYIRLCQQSPNRRPSLCNCGGVLEPHIAEDVRRGSYILLMCPNCDFSRECGHRELVAFRIFGELLYRMKNPINSQGEAV